MSEHAIQACRYELKYIVDETQARLLRELIRPFVERDDNMPPDCPIGYQVNSLYLDSLSFDLCRQTIHGHKNRFKLRLRFYDETGPIYAEIKQRVGNIVRKQRAVLRREAESWILRGGVGDCQGAPLVDVHTEEALRSFCRLRDRMGAVPQTYVAYTREAYMSPGTNDLRITFDRNLFGCRYAPGEGLHLPHRAAAVSTGGVVFEIKFTNTFPLWLEPIVRQTRIKRTSYPKYVKCVRSLKLPLSDRFPARLGVAS